MDGATVPDSLTFPLDGQPQALSLLAAKELRAYLQDQTDWDHNFGLENDREGIIIGKMFGVLVVRNKENEVGYLAAFSGKLAGGNHHSKFVPPVFDNLSDNSFLNQGMAELKLISQRIKKLSEYNTLINTEEINILKTARRRHSSELQMRLFDHYHFLNQKGETKSLNEIFKNASYKNPPSGAGECAAPKLLQYAYQQNMKPLAIAEFWWGQSPKSDFWKHGRFYPCCREKCGPILLHMLGKQI